MSGSKLKKALIVCLSMAFYTQPVLAQSYSSEPMPDAPPQTMDNSPQVDITQGMAEQSAMHALKSANLSGYVQTAAPIQQQKYPQNQYSQSMPAQPQFSGQNYSNDYAPQMPGPGYAAGNNGVQPCPQNMQNGYQSQMPQQGYNQACNNSNNSGCQSHGGLGLGAGVTQQVVGVVGAALLLNYATNGGVQNLMGNMRGRGFNNRFHTFGSGIGGNIYH